MFLVVILVLVGIGSGVLYGESMVKIPLGSPPVIVRVKWF